MTIRIDWQGFVIDDERVEFFDFCPFGISYMGFRMTKYLYIWLLFWVIGLTWSGE